MGGAARLFHTVIHKENENVQPEIERKRNKTKYKQIYSRILLSTTYSRLEFHNEVNELLIFQPFAQDENFEPIDEQQHTLRIFIDGVIYIRKYEILKNSCVIYCIAVDTYAVIRNKQSGEECI